MNQKPQTVRYAALAAAACAAIGAAAITQAEWEADHSLIPTPSASSSFYVISPTPRTGEHSEDADMDGLDATPTERTYDFPFWTRLSTYRPGMICIFQ